MKKFLSVLAGAVVLLGFAGSVFAAPLDLEISHRDSTDTTDVAQNVTPFSYNGNSLMYFQGTGTGDGSVTTGNYAMLNVGSGIAIAGGNISVTPFSIETTDGHLSDTLGIINGNISTLNTGQSSLSMSISTLNSEITALGSPFSVNSFMVNQASTSSLVATSTFNGFMSGAMVIKLAALSTTTPRSMATTTRSIVTGTGATGFQISSSRDAEVRYSTTIVTTSSIAGSQNGTVVLEIAPTNSATATDWSEIGRCTNGTSYTLAIAIQGVSTQACQITGYVPTGYFAKIRSINNSGTPTFTYNSGQEVLQ